VTLACPEQRAAEAIENWLWLVDCKKSSKEKQLLKTGIWCLTGTFL
jgi:hypothetical protein